jgi:N-acetylglucosaminyldiphosphoundecaprenol N-acetyl-beta-D-mannosaminyltransferase
MPKVRFLNVSVDNLTMDEAIAAADDLIRQRTCSFVATPNVDHLVLLDKNSELREAYEKANLVLADGMPMVWFSRFYGGKIKEKISGSDFLPKLCEMAAQKGYKIFFLGSAEGIARKAARNLEKQYPDLRIVGCYSPAMGFENDPEQMAEVDRRLDETKPDILAVALGCPKQELFIAKNKDRWQIPLSLGIGASLDFVAGRKKRAPQWMSNCGLEWFFRMWQEPGRMFKRYVLRDWRFLMLLWKYRKQK